jgi:hypothetical protein
VEKPNNNKWMVLISMPFQMGVVIFIFAYAGIWLDEKYPNPDNLYTKILTLLGVFIAMYQVIRQVNQLNDK